MKASLAALFIVLAPGIGTAQTAPAAPFTTTLPKEEKPAAAPDAKDAKPLPSTTTRPATVSPEMAAKIGSGAPKFSPPKEPEATKVDELPDLRDIDKPRNGIIRLPKVMVQESKAPAFKDRELLTPKAKIDLAYKRHPGLALGSLPFSNNNGIALFMIEEELRLERKSEMEELTGLYRYSDPKTGAAVQKDNNLIFLRHPEPYDRPRNSADP